MKHLIISYAAKQAGKTTSATAVYGYYLASLGVIPNANIDPNGRMSVIYNKKTSEGIYFDIDDDSPEMIDFKSKNVWPHIKHSSFADALKESIIKLFGVERKLIYGTDDDKNTSTHIKWTDVWAFLSEARQTSLKKKWLSNNQTPTYLTIREMCQVFGTDICREVDQNCHLRSGVKQLLLDKPTIGYIADGRFENEFFYFDTPEAKKLLGGTKVWRIKYTRNSSADNPPGEQGLPDVPEDRYDLVIDNRNMSVLEKNEILINFLIKNDVLSAKAVAKE